MKFRVERDVLADAVAWAARSLPVRPSVPVLAGLLIETSPDGDGLVLSTFDYETSARATIPADVSDEGRALVSGRLLADICRSLPNKPVEMTIDGAKVSLTCGSARFSLQTMPVDEYPTLPDMPAAAGTVASDRFAAAVSQAVVAAGRDDMLPVLTGVRIEIEGDSISLLATDRFRLSTSRRMFRGARHGSGRGMDRGAGMRDGPDHAAPHEPRYRLRVVQGTVLARVAPHGTGEAVLDRDAVAVR